MPELPGLRVQAVHSLDAGDAYRRALVSDVSGPFNIASEPVLDSLTLADVFGARRIKLPVRLVRGAVAAAFRLRMQPSEPGWLDLTLCVPLLDTSRARSELGWSPTHSAADALRELLGGIAEGAGVETPPLDPATSGPLRMREFATGIGQRDR